MKKTIVVEIITVLYIILFLYTGLSKLMDYSIFREQLEESPLLSSISSPIALGLPIAELAATLLLTIPRWRLKGLYASLVLMILFTSYVIGILIFDEHLPCSCGGIIGELSWPQHIVFNSSFIGLAVIAIVFEKKNRDQLRLAMNITPTQLYGITK